MNERSTPLYHNIGTLIRIVVVLLIIAGAAMTAYQVSQPVTIAWDPIGGPTRSIVRAVALDPANLKTIYAGTDGGGVYKSTDGGATWVQKNDGLESWQGLQTGVEHAHDIRDILISRTQPGAMYVATWGPEGIYRSDDDGETWVPQLIDVLGTGDKTDEMLTDESVHVRVLAETDTIILAGTDGGVFRLMVPDEGLWQPTSLKGEEMSVQALLAHPRDSQVLYAATLGQGIYKSGDGGQNWRPKSTGLDSEVARKVNALVFDPANADIIYAGTFGDGVYRSLDGGESWGVWSEGLPEGADVWSLCFAQGGTLFAGLRYGGTYKRTEPGGWQKANFRYGALTLEVDALTGALYVGTWGGGVFRDETGRDEAGEVWQNLGLPTEYLHLQAAVFTGPVPSTLYVGTNNDGVYVSKDGGQSWEQRRAGFQGKSLGVQVLAAGSDGRTVYAGTGDGVFASTDSEPQWRPVGKDTQPAGDFSIVSLAIGEDKQGNDVLYAGTRHGLWAFDRSRQAWDGPKEFLLQAPERPITEVLVQSLLAKDGAVYASVWGLGVYESSGLERRWQPVEMAPKYVAALALADKTWLQWGGQQFYALTERGLYGSHDGEDWGPLGPDLLEAITTDPSHPQVAYASTTPIIPEAESDATSAVTSTETVTSTVIWASVSDGREWQPTDLRDPSPIGGRVTHLARDPSAAHRVFALVTGGGLYRGDVHLPWLRREAVTWWLVGLVSFGIFVVAPYGYFNLLRAYGLSHRLAWGLVTHLWLLRRVRSHRFQNRFKPLERLILATMDRPRFDLVGVWEQLDEIGVSTSHVQLIRALEALAGYGLLQEQEGDFRYVTPGLQKVATAELKRSADALLEDVRREGRLLNDVERFFEAAGFDVRQDAPRLLTKFVLRPRRSLYRDYRWLYAWLRSQEPLRGTEVEAICQEAVEQHLLLTAGTIPTDHPTPVAFAVVTEPPEAGAFRQIRLRQAQVRLIPLSMTAIRSALRERSESRDLDMLVQQDRSQADLYDVRAPVIDWLDFFGRQDLIRDLRKELHEGCSVHIWGLPAIGKTSLLWHLKETLVSPVVAYVDLAYGWQGETLFHEQLITDLASDLWLKYERFFDERAVDFEERLLSIARKVPARGERDVEVVLLLDGLSTATGDNEQQRMLGHLRDLVDAHLNLALVMTWQDPEPAVAGWKLLGGLGEKESEQLITTIGAQMGLDFTPDSLESIYRETGGHPFLLRQLGSAIARQVPSRPPTEFSQVTPAWVEQALSDYRPLRDRYFEDVWRWCSPGQKENLKHWNEMTLEHKERLLNTDAYLRALVQPDEALSMLFVAWTAEAAEESRL